MSLRILGVVPARYASSRLPGKPLVDIGGKSMVQRVVEQALQARTLERVVVATDDERIAEHVRGFGGEAVLTAADHPSGTDRCAEAVRLCGADRYDAVLNIQGDEPFIAPAQIDAVCDALRDAPGGIATLAQVVTDVHGDALYFSRAAIPFLRQPPATHRHTAFRFLKHVGLYAYRTEVLARLVTLSPSPLELAESLEQLRWVENGHKVRVALTTHPSFCVDTPADLEEARRRAAGS
jgi:3-deoxy-manno-octulosonate cytidylyltransferase (CMP-KDO synthetase)